MGSLDFFFRTSGTNRLNARTFNEEFAEENITPVTSYLPNGVNLSEYDNTPRVMYDGLLAKSGAQHVYAVVGYGDESRWEDVEYHRMNKSGQTF